MKYTVELLQVKKTSTGKPMYHCNLTDEKGSVEAINLFDKVETGQVIEGEIYSNDKGYRNFKSTAQTAKSNFVNKQKEEVIEKFQDRKANQIAQAQDRTSWMWAKNNAVELLKNAPFNSNEELLKEINKLATKIYNMEPSEPF